MACSGKDKKKLIQISYPYLNTVKTCNRFWRSAMAITLRTFVSWQVIPGFNKTDSVDVNHRTMPKCDIAGTGS
jgi:hypothetical protein